MKASFLISFLLLTWNSFSKGKQNPIFFQPYSGVSNLFSEDANSFLWQAGFKLMPNGIPAYLLVENNYHNSTKHYVWPDVGDYSYKSKINIFSFGVGIQFLKTRKFSFSYGVRTLYNEYTGELKTDNQFLRDHVVNYTTLKSSAAQHIEASYRIRRNWSGKLSAFSFKYNSSDRWYFIALSIGYNIYRLGPHE